MKKSKFIIKQPGFSEGSVLIFSTMTTSIIEIEEKIYNSIFVNEQYEEYAEEVNELIDMGFLISDEQNELDLLEKLRIQTLRANNSSPSYYIICPTTACNARCFYCFEKGAVQKRMDKNTALAVANFILENHDQEHLVIQWFGGEPLLEPEIITYITDILHDNNISFDSKIITNGYLLNDGNVKLAINRWNVKIIQITIDDLENEYNRIKDYVYNDVNPFNTVMENITRGLKAGINLRIRINFNPLEYDKAIRTVEYLKNRFGTYKNFFVYLAPIDSSEIPPITDEFKDSNEHPLISLLNAEEDFCSFGNYDKATDESSQYDAILRKYYLTPIPTSCYGGCESSLTIDSMGNIFNCHRLLGYKEYASGNVFTGRITNEISEYYSSPYITNDECNNCTLLPLCQGGCKYRGFKYGNKHACTLIKGAVKELIKRAAKEIYGI